MGCSSSKRVEAAAIDVYRPPPSSFAVFNINTIEEPWLKAMEANSQKLDAEESDEKQYLVPNQHLVPSQIVEKLNAIEDAPRTWEEVSKALEDIKPSLHKIQSINTDDDHRPRLKTKAEQPPQQPPSLLQDYSKEQPPPPRKNFSFHTLEELDSKLSAKPNDQSKKEDNAVDSKFQKLTSPKKSIPAAAAAAVVISGPESRADPPRDAGYKPKPVKDNIFILRDKQERGKDGKPLAKYSFDPLSEFPEKCPPEGADSVVIYTTSLGGVRRTFEECNKMRSILESHQVVFDERDVSLHGKFLRELRELLEELGGGGVPRMFVKGRYIGGVEEVTKLNETGKLVRILNRARIEKGVGRLGCEGCGGARFVPCMECGGSCKILVGDVKERCPKCNENGLVLCPLCA